MIPLQHNDGTYSATLTSATERGTATVTGKIDQESIEDEVVVDFKRTTVETTEAKPRYTSAKLKGEFVEIKQKNKLEVFFEWREYESEDPGNWQATDKKVPEKLKEGEEFEMTKEELDKGEIYSFRAVVQWEENGKEEKDRGEEKTFTTYELPEVETKEAANVNHEEAILQGELINMGAEDEIEVWFEYRQEGEVWQETDEETFEETGEFKEEISGLEEGATYQFRIRTGIEWEGDPIRGSKLNFTTDSEPDTVSGGTGGGGGGGASSPEPVYTVTLEVKDEKMGEVEGEGTFAQGGEVTVKATPFEGYYFVGWEEVGIVSEEQEYTFEIEQDRDLVAVFDQYIVEVEQESPEGVEISEEKKERVRQTLGEQVSRLGRLTGVLIQHRRAGELTAQETEVRLSSLKKALLSIQQLLSFIE